MLTATLYGAGPAFSTSAAKVPVYDFVEVKATVQPQARNPFIDNGLKGELQYLDEAPIAVEGFCDAADGSLYRIRFLATKPGIYRYRVALRVNGHETRYQGTFEAVPSGRRGLVRVDAQHPFHFIWEGTGEHYFWNGLTTYALMGWQNDQEIRDIIDRAARFKSNRLRVSLNGPRVKDASRWYEPVKPSSEFQFLFGPWSMRGGSVDPIRDPRWDVNRYDVAFWQKYERMVRYAREKDVVISVIFFLDGEDAGADPFGKSRAFGPEEKRYYQYAAARLAAYSNVMWDVTNEWHLFRSAWWVQEMGSYLKAMDPWKHLISCHGRGDFPWKVSFWPDFAMFQLWDEDGGYDAMLQRRTAQADTGRPMPQINEEYGYEDHYPVKWGGNRRSPARSADNRRRLAWEIAMAGCYQTTGERANGGNGSHLPSPGGWINGGFDGSMRMLVGYQRMVDFFTSVEYWKLEPMPGVGGGTLRVLGEPGRQYVVYYQDAAATGAGLRVEPGNYTARWYNPRTGAWTEGAAVRVSSGVKWNAPAAPGEGDWALLLRAGDRF